MTVGELKKILNDIPEDRVIVLDSEMGKGDMITPDEVIGISGYEVRTGEYMYSPFSAEMIPVTVIKIS